MAYPYSADDVLTAADLNTGGLWRIFEGTMSGTTYSISDVFSSDFDNYRIEISNLGTTSSSTRTFSARFRTASDDTGTVYAYSQYGHYGATAFNGGASAQNAIQLSFISHVAPASRNAASWDVCNPNLAALTTMQGSVVGYNSSIGVNLRSSLGLADTITQYTGITFFLNASSFSGGIVRIYGYSQT